MEIWALVCFSFFLTQNGGLNFRFLKNKNWPLKKIICETKIARLKKKSVRFLQFRLGFYRTGRIPINYS